MLEWQQQDSLLFSRALLFLFTQQLSSPVLYLTVPCLCVHVLGLHLYLYTLRSNAQRGFQINKINIGEKKKPTLFLSFSMTGFVHSTLMRSAVMQRIKKEKKRKILNRSYRVWLLIFLSGFFTVWRFLCCVVSARSSIFFSSSLFYPMLTLSLMPKTQPDRISRSERSELRESESDR